MEFDPQNLLGTYLGNVVQPEQGVVSRAIGGHGEMDQVLTSPEQVRYLPYGVATPQQRSTFEQILAAAPHWLARCLQGIELPEPALVLIDTARAPSLYAEQAVAAADLILAIFCCDVPSAVGAEGLLRLRTDQRLACVINQADPTRRLQQDIRAVLQSRLKEWPLFVVHRDEAVPEALASNRALADFAPHSQAMHDLQVLANWVLETAESTAVSGS